MGDLTRPADSEMCPIGFHVVRGHNRRCESGTTTWVDAHFRKNPKKLTSGYLSENLLYLYWNKEKIYKKLSDIPNFKNENSYDEIIQFWLDYWAEQGLPFPDDFDPLMVKAIISVESSFNPNAKSKVKGSTAGGLMQLTDTAVRTLQGFPSKSGYFEVKKEKMYVKYFEKMDPVINIALGTRLLSYKFTKINKQKGFTKDAAGMIAAYNNFGSEGLEYAKKVLSVYEKAKKNKK
jgi:soluble lytic murein transglycosylase-like protein